MFNDYIITIKTATGSHEFRLEHMTTTQVIFKSHELAAKFDGVKAVDMKPV